jgi:hypothetical protein
LAAFAGFAAGLAAGFAGFLAAAGFAFGAGLAICRLLLLFTF